MFSDETAPQSGTINDHRPRKINTSRNYQSKGGKGDLNERRSL